MRSIGVYVFCWDPGKSHDSKLFDKGIGTKRLKGACYKHGLD